MASLPHSYFGSTNGVFRVLTIAISTIGTAMNHAVEAIVAFGREVRRWLEDEPRLPRFTARECPPIIEARFVERSKAPLFALEPSFVGAGPMLRRWR